MSPGFNSSNHIDNWCPACRDRIDPEYLMGIQMQKLTVQFTASCPHCQAELECRVVLPRKKPPNTGRTRQETTE